MYHDGLGQAPRDNTQVDLTDVGGVLGSYYDFGGEWQAIPGQDGTTHYLIQQVPTDTPPELIAYIIQETGGDGSPYRAPVYTLAPQEPKPGQAIDRMSGRPLDETGRYTVSYVVNGKIHHVPHFPCGDAACIAQGANVDYSEPSAQAYARALDAKAVKNVGTAVTAGVVVTSGPVSLGLSIGATGLDLYEGFLSEEASQAASKAALVAGFERYAKARGLSSSAARKLSAVIDLTGRWDAVVENGQGMMGLGDE